MTKLPDSQLQDRWDEVEMLTMRVEKQRIKIRLLKEIHDRGKVTKVTLVQAINEFRDLLQRRRQTKVELDRLLDNM